MNVPLGLMGLTVRVLCDVPAWWSTDSLYLFGQTEDNQESEFNRLVEVPHEWYDKGTVAICGAPAKNGYPGAARWTGLVRDRIPLGTSLEEVRMIGSETANTLSEARGLVALAKERNWRSIALLSTPFHQVRAFMTVVGVLLSEYPELRVHNFVGRALSWQAEVVHSQGVLKDTRAGLLRHEEERIWNYQQSPQWPLPTFEAVLAYLDWRD